MKYAYGVIVAVRIIRIVGYGDRGAGNLSLNLWCVNDW